MSRGKFCCGNVLSWDELSNDTSLVIIRDVFKKKTKGAELPQIHSILFRVHKGGGRNYPTKSSDFGLRNDRGAEFFFPVVFGSQQPANIFWQNFHWRQTLIPIACVWQKFGWKTNQNRGGGVQSWVFSLWFRKTCLKSSPWWIFLTQTWWQDVSRDGVYKTAWIIKIA